MKKVLFLLVLVFSLIITSCVNGTKEVESLDITNGDSVSLKVGETLTLEVSVSPTGVSKDKYQFKIVSGSEKVSLSGDVLTAVSVGEAVVTVSSVKDEEINDSITIVVTPAPSNVDEGVVTVITNYFKGITTNYTATFDNYSESGTVTSSKSTVRIVPDGIQHIESSNGFAKGLNTYYFGEFISPFIVDMEYFTQGLTPQEFDSVVNLSAAEFDISTADSKFYISGDLANVLNRLQYFGDSSSQIDPTQLYLNGLTSVEIKLSPVQDAVNSIVLNYSASLSRQLKITSINKTSSIMATTFSSSVKVPSSSITVDGVAKAEVDLPVQLTYQVLPAGSLQSVKFTSSNEEVATVSKTGVITAHSVGTTVITLEQGSLNATYSLTTVAAVKHDQKKNITKFINSLNLNYKMTYTNSIDNLEDYLIITEHGVYDSRYNEYQAAGIFGLSIATGYVFDELKVYYGTYEDFFGANPVFKESSTADTYDAVYENWFSAGKHYRESYIKTELDSSGNEVYYIDNKSYLGADFWVNAYIFDVHSITKIIFNLNEDQEVVSVDYIYSGNANESAGTGHAEFTDIGTSINTAAEVFFQEHPINLNTKIGDPFVPDRSTFGTAGELATVFTATESRLEAAPINTLPPSGTTKSLVIPIQFPNIPFTSQELHNIDVIYRGTAQDTNGWESLQSYYYKSSYGKLNLDITILPVFTAPNPSTYYVYTNDVGPGKPRTEYPLMEAALAAYDSTVDYSQYDNNGDGFIDAVYFVYSTPYNHDSHIWWAYVSIYHVELGGNADFVLDGVRPSYYNWSSIKFSLDSIGGSGFGSSFINCETYIHETGHLLGFPDLYDYDDSVGPKGGLGGFDMMDYNAGDHGPFNKIVFGWVDPLVTGTETKHSGEYRIANFQSDGVTEDPLALVIAPKWVNTYFTEYLVINFYTPTRLNLAHKNLSILPSNPALVVYHVDANLNTFHQYLGLFKNDNSDSDNKLIKIVEADKNNSIENSSSHIISASDFLYPGGSYQNTGSNAERWYYNGAVISYSITNIRIEGDSIVFTLTFS
ncbi:MAG: Ig-like domain-containing protein [Acholeplasmatales bacterium]|jgi:M6 family metalloprotease-like protein|nr:Ig-like domain-containing protein [Acholeplasmatales bacterium]